MCDVDCGSETVGMVKQVLAWKKDDPEGSKKLWDELQGCNETLAKKLTAGAGIEEFRKAFGEIRERIREMGTKSGVPIEPKEQTELLDAVTAGVEGVAGGVLVKDDEETMSAIEKFLEKWSKEKGSNVKLLGTRGELEGARKEDASRYVELVK